MTRFLVSLTALVTGLGPLCSGLVASQYSLSFFQTWRHYAMANPSDVATADFNKDGKLDVVAADLDDGFVVLFGDGRGILLRGPTIPTIPADAGVGHVVAADWDGDGNPDIAGLTSAGDILLVFGHGDGTFGPPIGIPVRSMVGSRGAGDAAAAGDIFAAADINTDGKSDLVYASQVGSQEGVMVMLNRGGGEFQDPIFYALPSVVELVVVDLNGDGKPDLAVTSLAHGEVFGFQVAVGLGYGDGTFGPPQSTDVAAEVTEHPQIAAGDLNRDGKPDLVVGDSAFVAGEYVISVMEVLLGKGDGSFEAPIFGVSDIIPEPYDLAVADVNGDGFPDVVEVRSPLSSDRTVELYLGMGDGRLRHAGTNRLSGPTSAAPAALRPGGRTDVVVVARESIAAMLNGGEGRSAAGSSGRSRQPIGPAWPPPTSMATDSSTWRQAPVTARKSCTVPGGCRSRS